MYSEFTLLSGKCYYVYISLSSVSLISLSRLIMFLVRRTLVFMILRLAPLCDLIVCSPLDSLFQFGSFNGSPLDWLPHLYYEHSGLRLVQFYNTLCTFCSHNFPQLFQVLLLNALAPLCNTSNFLHWKLRVSTIWDWIHWLYTPIFLLIPSTWELKSDKYCTSIGSLFPVLSIQ